MSPSSTTPATRHANDIVAELRNNPIAPPRKRGPTIITVKVPDSVGEGERFAFQHNGVSLYTFVPPGCAAGGTFRAEFPDLEDPDVEITVATTITTVTENVTTNTCLDHHGHERKVTTTTTTMTSTTTTDNVMSGGPDFLERLEIAEARDAAQMARETAPENVAVGIPYAHSVVPFRASSPGGARSPHAVTGAGSPLIRREPPSSPLAGSPDGGSRLVNSPSRRRRAISKEAREMASSACRAVAGSVAGTSSPLRTVAIERHARQARAAAEAELAASSDDDDSRDASELEALEPPDFPPPQPPTDAPLGRRAHARSQPRSGAAATEEPRSDSIAARLMRPLISRRSSPARSRSRSRRAESAWGGR